MEGVKNNSLAESRSKRTSSAQRARWVRRFHASGLSQKDFVARHGMGFSTLSCWIAKQKSLLPLKTDESSGDKVGSPLRWQELSLPAPTSANSWAAELVLKNGSILRLSLQAATSLLQPWMDSRS